MSGVGEVVRGRYRLDAELGHGSFATVYRATDTELDQACVVKELDLGKVRDLKQVELFEREGRVLESLDHPCIPAHRASFAVEGDGRYRLFLVQDLVEGESLAARVEAGARWSETEILDLGLRIIDVLEHLHGLRPPVIHRDIKPSNVMLRPDGSIAVIDFGAVRDVLRQAGADDTIVGTYGYMAPEMLQGRAEAATDYYALGATLLRLATGRDPADFEHEQLRLQLGPATELSGPLRSLLEGLLEPDIAGRAALIPTARGAFERAKRGDEPFPPASRRVAWKRLAALGVAPIALAGVALVALRSDDDPAEQPSPTPPSVADAIPPPRPPELAPTPAPEPRPEPLMRGSAGEPAQWVRLAGGSRADRALDVAVDGAGEVYVTGAFKGTADFSGTSLQGRGGGDAFVAAYDPAGALRWVVAADGPGAVIGASISVTGAEDVYVAGTFNAKMSLGGHTLANRGKTDGFVARLSRTGKVKWLAGVGGPGTEHALQVVEHPAGDATVLAALGPNAKFREQELSTDAYCSFVAFRINVAGALRWKLPLGECGLPIAGAVGAEKGDYSWIAVSVRSAKRLGIPRQGDEDPLVLVWVEPDGRVIWKRRAGANVAVMHLGVETPGSWYLAGTTRGIARFEELVVDSETTQGFIAKYDYGGRLRWARPLVADDTVIVGGLAVPGYGKVHLAGRHDDDLYVESGTLPADGPLRAFHATIDGAGRIQTLTGLGHGFETQGLALTAKQAPVFAGVAHASVTILGSDYDARGKSDAFVMTASKHE